MTQVILGVLIMATLGHVKPLKTHVFERMLLGPRPQVSRDYPLNLSI